MTSETHQIRDPIYGYIKLSDDERKVLDSPQVQRLRRINQLGLSSLTYPGATHTRFEHSLGVMHLAGRFADALGLSEDEVSTARIAGLLHDTGHGPFSHASETADNIGYETHEQRSCEIVEELSGIIPAATNKVKGHIQGNADINIIAGTIDADRMDYLRRDSNRTGIEHGTIDTSTIIQYADIEEGELVFDRKCIQALEGLLTARFHMIKSVYYHHTSAIAETMLERAIEDFATQTNKEIVHLDDYEMHSLLRNESDGEANRLYERLKNRNLYKRCVILGQEELSREKLELLENESDAREMERYIAQTAGVDEKYVLINTPITPTHRPFTAKIRDSGAVKRLSSISPIPNALLDAEWRTVSMDVYTPEDFIDEVNDAAFDVIQSFIDDR